MKNAQLMTWMLSATVSAGIAANAFAATPPATPAPPAVPVNPATPATTAAPATPAAAAAQGLAADSVNDAALVATVGPKSQGAATLRAQILLDRARFSPGEIDGAYGSNVQRAIAGFQANNDIKPSGVIDAATWTALNRDTAPALVNHVLSAEDVAGPFTVIPADMMEKSKLPALGYTSALEALGEKFHASPKLLQKLNPGQDFSKAGVAIVVPSVESTALAGVAKVVVDKSAHTVSLLDAADKVLAQYPASTGSVHDPLPVGAWKIKGVAKNPEFHYNPGLFWDANAGHSKATIKPGPNNPVGVVWMDLSKEHYGIHGTPEPSKIGKTESHGCIRMTNWSAQAMSQALTPGMPALLQD